MQRASVSALASVLLAGFVLVLPGSLGCGRGDDHARNGDLTFERLADTTGLANGPALVEGFEVYRITGNALRVRGRFRLPDGTRLRIALKRPEGGVALAAVETAVQDGAIDSPPLSGSNGPFPVGRWRIELSAEFTPDRQPAAVLRATENGKALRGPGITRAQGGGAVFWLVEEVTR